jgi:predicted PilT family ATPase
VRLTELIEGEGPLAVSEPVVTEVIGGLIDCMVASVAMRHGTVLLAHDIDAHRVAGVVGLEMDAASLRA